MRAKKVRKSSLAIRFVPAILSCICVLELFILRWTCRVILASCYLIYRAMPDWCVVRRPVYLAGWLAVVVLEWDRENGCGIK